MWRRRDDRFSEAEERQMDRDRKLGAVCLEREGVCLLFIVLTSIEHRTHFYIHSGENEINSH
jgi:hypothetical protein